MLRSVQISTVTDTLSVFSSLDLILDSLSAASSLRRLIRVLQLTGQYLSFTTDMKFLKLGLSIKDRGRLHKMMRFCIMESGKGQVRMALAVYLHTFCLSQERIKAALFLCTDQFFFFALLNSET